MSTSSLQESVSSNTSTAGEVTECIPCESCALPPTSLEDAFPTLDTKTNQFVRMPDTEYIFISLDVHHICGEEPSASLDRPSCRHDPVIEAGIAYLDMRDILYDRGKGVIPGDRGSSWFKYMTPLHYIAVESENQDTLDQSPYLFAFGRSRRVQEKDLAYRLYRVFAALKKKNRRKDEIEQGRLRQLILLTIDAECVKTTLLQLGLEWLGEPNVQIWDLKKEKQFETRIKQPAVFEHVLERLGIRFEDTRFGKLTSCSGNATVFMIQMILAFFYIDEGQKALFEDRRPLSWLRYTWVGHSLDQLNLALGELPKRRHESEMNRHDVPQRQNEKAFGINITISYHTSIIHTNKSPHSIEYIITVADNVAADRHITHHKVINDESTDDKMADDKGAGEKASDNKSTEKITPETKASEGENTEETSKDDGMTEAQHSDGVSAEDEVAKLSVIRQHLSAEIPDLLFNVLSKEGLGLPSQFHYPSAYDWLRKIIYKFHAKGEKADDDDEGKQIIKPNSRVPSTCRKCIIQGHLDRWTTEARLITGYEKLWAMCGLLRGMEEDDPGILTPAKRYTDKLEGRVTEHAQVLQRLLEETPEPSITVEEYRRRGIPRTQRAVLREDLEYYIGKVDYFVEVEVDSDSLEEEDEHDNDHELPPLKSSSRAPEGKENTP
ncbi:unnamed protein product [Fusarium fujikuroi]|uniref:Gfd2/YDR514C-like C-terminal domain-containing protein n=1 Tax=Fusarium fujikuroi TaxID=5127 RepID=A0A9Q9RB96_FUSFU|nr:unnamed protein product [Fusarium fujikuroi]VTT77438.1 unnamed protein product [Fusarium fujikuroi]VZI14400.1 unnamed protein product [Fusarium fujikuroi]